MTCTVRTARRVIRCAAGIVVLVVVAAAPLWAASVKNRYSWDRLPGWVRDAAGRQAPPSSAGFAILHQETIVEPLAEGGVREVRRVAIKVLAASGMQVADTSFLHYRTDDQVRSMEAYTVLPDRTVLRARLDDHDGDIVDRPYVSAGAVYEAVRQRVATATGVVVGAVVAHEYEVVRALDTGARSHVFGHPDAPTVESRVTLLVPAGWEHGVEAFRADGLTREDGERDVTFTGRGLDALPFEELRPPADEILPLVWLRWTSPDGSRGFTTWDAVGRWFRDLSEPVFAEAGPVPALAARLAPQDGAGPVEFLTRAYDLVARDVRYVAIEIGIGGFRPEPPASVYRDGYGDCKGKTFLLRALVESRGLKSYPVYLLTRDRGTLPTDVPTIGAFNHVIAAVALPAGVGENLWPTAEVEGLGRLWFIDGTARYGDGRHLPPMDQGVTALVVHEEGTELVTLPVQPETTAHTRIVVEASVDSDGTLLAGSLVREHRGYRASVFRAVRSPLDQAERERLTRESIQGAFAGASVVEYTVQGLDEDHGTVIETIRAEGGRLGKRVANLLILEPGQAGDGALRASLPPPPRIWDLELPSPREEDLEIRITPPPGWLPDELPADWELSGAALEGRGTWRFEDGTLVYRRSAALNAQRVAREAYAEFRESLMRLNGEDARAVILNAP